MPIPVTNISEQEKQEIKSHYCFLRNILLAIETFGVKFLLPHTQHLPTLIPFITQNIASVDFETRKVSIRILKLLILNVVVVREAVQEHKWQLVVMLFYGKNMKKGIKNIYFTSEDDFAEYLRLAKNPVSVMMEPLFTEAIKVYGKVGGKPIDMHKKDDADEQKEIGELFAMIYIAIQDN